MIDLDVHAVAIAAGDAAAFGRWMSGCEATVRDSLAAFAAAVDVEAVLQEALLRVWQVAPRFAPDGRPNGLLRLAIRIARNLAITEVRRVRAAPVPTEDLEVALADAQAAPRPPDPALRAAIGECRDQLPDKPRRVLALRLSGGEDGALAAVLGMQLNTFLQNFTRARKLLAECLRRRGIHVDQELAA